MIFVDSSVWIDYFNGIENWQVEKLNELLGKDLVIVGDYILAEVLQGFRNVKDFHTARNVFDSFDCFSICGKEIAIKSAENYRKLRQKGITIRKTIDLIIGTFCIENDFLLLHNDKDFFPMEKHLGLQTVAMKSS